MFGSIACDAKSVHPHACGEYRGPIRAGWPASRFTPTRVGNTAVTRRDRHARRRFTPTRVGNTAALADRPPRRRFTPTRVGNTCSTPAQDGTPVHPHVCGEYVTELRADRVPMRGSPPRVWGIRTVACAMASALRFTPTRVGNTDSSACPAALSSRFTPTRVGNTLWMRSVTRIGRFTPTRVGNTCRHHVRSVDGTRFTPTRVGNTHPHRLRCLTPVHPHACGEYSRAAAWTDAPVHPHACGEYCTRARLAIAHAGSPPRVWGIRGRATCCRCA